MSTLIRPYEPRLNIIRNGLIMWMDASLQTSYPGSGSTWSDLSGNGLNGTLTNGPTYSSSNGGSIVLDGTDDFITCGDNNNFTMNSGYTLSIWVKMNNVSNTNSQPWIAKYATGSGGYEWTFGLFNDNRIYCFNISASFAYIGRYASNATSYLTSNTWVNCVATYNGGFTSNSIKIYINTIQRDDTNFQSGVYGGMPNSNEPLTIGRKNDGVSPNDLEGSVGQVLIYNRALSADEIAHNYNRTKSRFGL